MATVGNVIKKAEKVTKQKVSICERTGQVSVMYKNYTLSFYANGKFSNESEAICFYATNIDRCFEYRDCRFKK